MQPVLFGRVMASFALQAAFSSQELQHARAGRIVGAGFDVHSEGGGCGRSQLIRLSGSCVFVDCRRGRAAGVRSLAK